MSWHKGQAFGQDLCDRVLSASGAASEVAYLFQVSSTYVRSVRKRQRQGQTTPGTQCNHVQPKLAGLEPSLHYAGVCTATATARAGGAHGFGGRHQCDCIFGLGQTRTRA